MNKETAAQWLPIVTALAEGKQVEVRDGAGVWKVHYELKFDQCVNDYRVVEPEKTPGQILYEILYGDTWDTLKCRPGDLQSGPVKTAWEDIANEFLRRVKEV